MKHKVNIRKIILGASSIGLLGITLTTSTYAWFKLNSKAQVENFNISVIGGKGFAVSVDGGTFTNDLTEEQLKQAIAVKYGNGKYELGYEADENGKITNSNVLYEVVYDNNNEVKKVKVEDVDAVLTKSMKNIELLPTTTKDGRKFTDLYNAGVSLASGRYVEFDVYFKATSTILADNLKYDIYMDAYDGNDENGNRILPTSISSEVTQVRLMKGMNTYQYLPDGTKQLKTYDGGDTINVYSSNAMRISTTSSVKTAVPAHYALTKNLTFVEGKKYYTTSDNGITFIEATYTADEEIEPDTYYEYIPDGYAYEPESTPSLIYELNDTESLNTDLGSYATNYDTVNTDEYYLYASECNAMFTYYNNLKVTAPLQPFEYGAQPKTIKSLPTKSREDIKASDYDTITTVESGKDAKLVTFRIWLEGWDADCFDGLANSINVRMSFGSSKAN